MNDKEFAALFDSEAKLARLFEHWLNTDPVNCNRFVNTINRCIDEENTHDLTKLISISPAATRLLASMAKNAICRAVLCRGANHTVIV